MAAATASRGVVTFCVMGATVMQALDTTIANVALPYMQGNLSATQDQVNWILTSYIIAAAIMTPVTGFLAGRFGRKKLFCVTVAGFTAASVLCGMAQSIEQMVLFRLLQGVFGAPLVPLGQSVLLDAYPRERHAHAMALWGMGVMIGPILGPSLGGWLTENHGWRWVFWINLPVGILAFVGLSRFLEETRLSAASFDWFGFLSLSLALGAFQLMLDRGEQVDWFDSTETKIEAGLAVLGLWLFLAHTFTSEQPFVDPRIFADRNFALGMIFLFVMGIILLASLALLTPFLQTLLGYPALTAGQIMAPRGMGTLVAMTVVGRIAGHVDLRLLVLLGLSLNATVLGIMSGFTPDVSTATIVWTGFFQGMGLGFCFVPLSTMGFATLDPAQRTQAAALFALSRSLGSSIGISVVIFMLGWHAQVMHATLGELITPFNAALRAPDIAGHWDITTMAGRAAIDHEVKRQAAIIAYANDFRMMMFIAIGAMFMVPWLRSPPRATGEPKG